MAKNFENLKVWQESVKVAGLLYQITRRFPKEELYGLTSQIRRAAVSVSANIAEGAGRASQREFVRFINIALGSLNEVESLLYVAIEIKYIDREKFETLVSTIQSLGASLGALKKHLVRC